MPTRRRKRRVRRLPALRRRWLGLAALALIAFLYFKPLRTYLETRDALAQRAAEVSALAARNAALERRAREQGTTAALVREARRLGYVKPGERLFIVKGIPAWRRARAHPR